MCRNRNLGQIPQKNFLNSHFIIPEKEEVESTHVPEKMQQSVHSLFPFHMGSCLLLNGKHYLSPLSVSTLLEVVSLFCNFC